jgi:hypothetical protein
MTTIMLDLPDQTMEQARQAAVAVQKPVEEVLTNMLAAILPVLHDTPVDMQAELTQMTWLDSQKLWEIARSSMSVEAQKQLQHLVQCQEQRSLTTDEQEQLEALRQVYGRTTLRKARAYALLSLRGGKPLLEKV